MNLKFKQQFTRKSNTVLAGFTAVILCSGGLLSSTASADSITLYQRQITDSSVLPKDYWALQFSDTYGNPSPTTTATPNYMTAWSDQSSPITQQTLSTTGYIQESGQVFNELTVSFSIPVQETLGFIFSVDAGYGGALYMNNQLIGYNSSDIYWGNPSGLVSGLVSATSSLSSTPTMLQAGNYTLTAYWAESCCDDRSWATFNVNGGIQQDLSGLLGAGGSTGGNPLPTPIPAAIWMVGSALAGLIGFGRRKLLV